MQIRLDGNLPTPAAALPTVFITSVNGGEDIQVNQAAVNIVGGGFTASQGTVEYDGIEITVGSWTDCCITVAWPDVPFDSKFLGIDIGDTRQVSVHQSGFTGSAPVTIAVHFLAFYGVVTSIPVGSIYTGADIELGVDKAYSRVLTGSVGSIDPATGLPTDEAPGTTYEFMIYDVSATTWRS